jgi:hypothetical protein
MLRIDPHIMPMMFHYATISKGEIDILRTISNVIRKGRVRSIDNHQIILDEGTIPARDNALYIDCTASAVEPRPAIPIFADNLITPQLVRAPQPAFSAALIAYVEANYQDDATKNALCKTVPFPHTLDAYPACNMANMMNQMAWMQDKVLSQWIRQCRLDGFGKVIAAIAPDDKEKQAVIKKFRDNAMAAMGNLHRLDMNLTTS